MRSAISKAPSPQPLFSQSTDAHAAGRRIKLSVFESQRQKQGRGGGQVGKALVSARWTRAAKPSGQATGGIRDSCSWMRAWPVVALVIESTAGRRSLGSVAGVRWWIVA